MSARRGHSLPELLTALAVGGLVCAALAASLDGGQRLARSMGGRVSAAEAIRVSGGVLAGELRYLDPAVDIHAIGADSLAIRVFRGAAVVCAATDDGALVRYDGLRAPDPAKDSVLALDSLGRAHPVALFESAGADDACAAGAGRAAYRWTLAAAPPRGTLLLLFEAGSYHLADRALRYRRGAGGRQPLTEELLDGRRSGFRPAGVAEGDRARGGLTAIDATVAIRARPDVGSRGRLEPRVIRFRFALLNGVPRPAEGA